MVMMDKMETSWIKWKRHRFNGNVMDSMETCLVVSSSIGRCQPQYFG